MNTGHAHIAIAVAVSPDEEDTTPEHRLMLAVLQEAITTFQRGLVSQTAAARRLFVEADAWIRSDDVDSPFSFEVICSTLHIDAEYLRAGLAQIKRRALQQKKTSKVRQVRRQNISDRRCWMGQIGS